MNKFNIRDPFVPLTREVTALKEKLTEEAGLQGQAEEAKASVETELTTLVK